MTKTVLLACACLASVWSRSAGATMLEQYEFQGLSGSETSVAASFIAADLASVAFGETGVTPSAGANSINASGWSNASAAYTFGFTVTSGYTASVDGLVLSTRSSATGPGSLSLQASVDGGAYATVAAITQVSTSYNDEMLSITPLTGITQGVSFRIVPASQVSAGGGTIGSAGTFRVGDYNPAGTPTPFTLNGSVMSVALPPPPPVGTPEPATLLVLGAGLTAIWGARRVRA